MLKIFFNLILLCFLFSCQSVQIQKKMNQHLDLFSYAGQLNEENNSLCAYEACITLPKHWSFHSKNSQDHKEMIFKFKDNENNISGFYELIKVDFEFDYKKLSQFYANSILKNVQNIKVYSTIIDLKKAYVLTGESYKGWDIFVALVMDKKNIHVIYLSSEKDFLFQNSSLAYKIFTAFRTNSNQESSRKIKSFLNFYDQKKHWTWFNDYRNNDEKGYFVLGQIRKLPAVIGIVSTKKRKIENLYPKHEFQYEPFNAYIKIKNKFFRVKAKAEIVNNFLKVYYLLNYKKQNYVILVSILNLNNSIDPHELHKEELFKEAFLEHFYFD